MRKGGGKAKGSAFEREVCRRLSLWVSSGRQEDVFWRSAMSGGRSTVAKIKGKRLAAQAGDISCIHPIGQHFADTFLVECKNYRDLNFIGLLSGKGNLLKFWDSTRKEASHYNKYPLLVAKQNQHPTFACLDADGVYVLNTQYLFSLPQYGLWITLFNDMLEKLPPFVEKRNGRPAIG